MEHWYDLNGGILRIEMPDEALLAPLRVYLDELRCEPTGSASLFHITIRSSHELPASEMGRILYEGPLPDAANCRLIALPDGRQLVIPGCLSLEISTEKRSALFIVAPGQENHIGGSAGLMAIDAALASCNQHLVHAAALRLPRREAAILLWAPSGAGKTTSSLALAMQGFALLTDDATVLASGGEPTRVWGLPRPLKVHRRTAAMLPVIGALLGDAWDSEGEQALHRSALKAAFDLPPPRPVGVAAMIVVGPRVTGRHIVRPLPKADVLVKLADNNIRRAVHGVPGDELARYQSLARAVAAAPVFELNVGSDLATLGGALLAAID